MLNQMAGKEAAQSTETNNKGLLGKCLQRMD